MTNEQINAAIAEACGWKASDHPDCLAKKVGWTMPEKWIMHPDGSLGFRHDIPNYCGDLNAMHEAEGTLGKSLYQMEAQLKRMAGAICFHASARQRAEAFLRMLGKWKEVQP